MRKQRQDVAADYEPVGFRDGGCASRRRDIRKKCARQPIAAGAELCARTTPPPNEDKAFCGDANDVQQAAAEIALVLRQQDSAEASGQGPYR